MRNPTWAVLFAATVLGGGCASLHNPVSNAIPVRRLPDEVLLGCGACAPGCDAVVRVQKPAPAAGAKDVTPARGEQSDAPPATGSDAPVGPLIVWPAPGPAPAGCGTCAVYYTGGALGPGAHPLRPDMRVTEAIAAARGPLHPVCGQSGASRVTVLRRLPGCQQIAIRVDLKEALCDPRENITVWPDDMILTQETCGQTACRVFGQLFHVGARLPVRVLTGGTVP